MEMLTDGDVKGYVVQNRFDAACVRGALWSNESDQCRKAVRNLRAQGTV